MNRDSQNRRFSAHEYHRHSKNLGDCRPAARVVYSIPNTIKPTVHQTLANGELGTPACAEFSFCTSEPC